MNNNVERIHQLTFSKDMLNKYILSDYNYKILDIADIKYKNNDRARAVFKVQTEKGYKCLKKVFYNEGNLLFIYSVIEWLNLNNIACPKLISTKSGHKYVNYNNQLFIMTDWIEGRKCDYDSTEDIKKISYNLARIHASSLGFRPIYGSYEMQGDNSFYMSLDKHFKQLMDNYKLAKKSKDTFSKLYIQDFEYNRHKALESLSLIKEIDFSRAIGDEVSMKAICHLDYVNKNIIFTENNRINLIDFDNTRMDMPVHDMSYYLKRIMKREKTDWDFEVFSNAINSYERARKLSNNEFKLLYVLLSYPQKYWKISRDYYKNYKVCNQYNYVELLRKVSISQSSHSKFCNQFKTFLQI